MTLIMIFAITCTLFAVWLSRSVPWWNSRVLLMMGGGLGFCFAACGHGVPSSTEAVATTAAPAASETRNGAQPVILRIPPASRPFIEVEAVATQKNTGAVQAPARVAFRDAAMSSVGVPVAGRIMKVHVQIGETVRVGTPLVTLHSPTAATARAKLVRAQVELQSATEMAKRQATMLEKGVGLEVEKFAADMRLREAQAEAERASKAAAFLGEGMGDTVVIRAPIGGTVVQRTATVGAAVEPGGPPLVEIGDAAALWVVADVFERELGLIHAGAETTVDLASLSQPVHGRVASVGAVVTAGLRRAPVYIALDDTRVPVRAGMYARVTIHATAQDGISLPVAAVLIKDGQHATVYVENGDGMFTPREVTVGQAIDGRVHVLAGVVPGEHVVVRGALLLDGAAEQLL